jgi:hypothetical protein
MNGVSSFVEQLREPAYVHVLLNPLPIYGLALGTAGLAAALLACSRAAQTLALTLVLFSAVSAWPVYSIGQRAYNRIYKISDSDGQAMLDMHKHRAERAIFGFALLAVVSAVALFFPIKKPRTGLPLAWCALFLAVVTLSISSWIAWPGGKIRHPEFRQIEKSSNESHDHR